MSATPAAVPLVSRVRGPRPSIPRLARTAAVAALVAAISHLVASVQHRGEGWSPSGVLVAVAAALAVLAVLLFRRPGTRVLLWGIWGTVVMLGAFVLSRTIGLPFISAGGATDPRAAALEPHGGHAAVAGGHGNGVPIMPQTSSAVETVGLLDLTTLGAELALVALLVGMLPKEDRRAMTTVMLVLGIVLWVTRVTGVLT